MNIKPIYNQSDWVLCICTICATLNYVEPHGITAECPCSPIWTIHVNVPYAWRTASGLVALIPTKADRLAYLTTLPKDNQ